MEFDPPIASRTTEDLIGIAHFPEDWNPEAVSQARKELANRGITEEEQQKTAKILKKELDKFNAKLSKERSEESYTYLDLFFMFLYLPRTILWDWYLKKEGYHNKHKQRLHVIGFGILFWIITLSIAGLLPDKKAIEWQNGVNNQDIYEWERGYYSDEELANFRTESIEQAIKTVKENLVEGTPTYVILESDTISNFEIEQLRNIDPLSIRDVIFEGDFDPEFHERILIKLVKPVDNSR